MIPHKVYAAYAAAVAHQDQPTVILAKTVKGLRHGRIWRRSKYYSPAKKDE